jgi:hypothetical protein
MDCRICHSAPVAVEQLCVLCWRDRQTEEHAREAAWSAARLAAHRWRGRPPSRYRPQDDGGHTHGTNYLKARQQVLHDRPG